MSYDLLKRARVACGQIHSVATRPRYAYSTMPQFFSPSTGRSPVLALQLGYTAAMSLTQQIPRFFLRQDYSRQNQCSHGCFIQVYRK
ncbi:hypothetical protein E2C01_048086 [Portunus trituberculatus]|uniref:Uncharacterized protein n=1 Tax=Portunus trituberculatus TaxID=210409 RepID=A0A5B7GAL2_PORTR|nr:hypothetical protein [Portunus trituberculatus]